MLDFHFKYGQCENCGLKIRDGEFLQVIYFWQNRNSRLIPSYLYVCENCFKSRKIWCKNIFPENCEICNEIIEHDDCYLQKELNNDGTSIETYGIELNEECKIICFKCKNKNYQNNTKE